MAETFNRTSTTLTTTSATDIYQVPSGNAGDRSILLSILACNVDTLDTPSVTLRVTDASSNVLSTLVLDIPLPLQSSLESVVNKYVLKSGEKIQATASIADAVSLTVSALEVTV